MGRKGAPHSPADVTQGNDPGISRRALLNASGASAAMLVLAPLGSAKTPSVVPLPSSSPPPSTSGYGYLATLSLAPGGMLALTRVSADGGTVIADDLAKVVVSPDGESVAYAKSSSRGPLHAPVAYSVLNGHEPASRAFPLKLASLGSGPSFTNSCILPGDQNTVVTCCDSAHSSDITPGGGKQPTQAFSLLARTVIITTKSGSISLSLPVADGDFIGAEVVPIDNRYAVVITSGLTRKITGKSNGPSPPNTEAHCYIVDTLKGELNGRHAVHAGPGAADEITSGNGVFARVVGGARVELIYASRPPVSYEVPLARPARRYVSTGYANPAAGTLVLFDFALAELLKLDLDTGSVAARSVVPLTRQTPPRAARPAFGVDAGRGQLLLADPGNPKSGVWIVDLDRLTVTDRWLSLMPISDIRVVPGPDRVAVRSPGSSTALLVDHDGHVAGHFELSGQLV
jgi:hypothetical protein